MGVFGLYRLQMAAQAHPHRLRPLQKGGFPNHFDGLNGGHARNRVGAIRAAQAAGMGRIHDVRSAGHGRNRQARPQRFGRGHQIGRDAIMLHRKQLARPPKARLNLVRNHHNAVLVANFPNATHEAGRRRHKTTFALHRLNHNGGHIVGVNLGNQRIVELADAKIHILLLVHRRGAAVQIGEGQAVNLGRERPEPFLEEGIFAGHAQREVGTAVVRPLKHDNPCPLGVGAGNVDGRLDSLRPAVHKQRLFGKVAGGDGVHQFGRFHHWFIGGHDATHVEQLAGLGLDRLNNVVGAVPHSQHANAACHVQQLVAVYVCHDGASGRGDGDVGQFGRPVGRGRFPPRDKFAALRAGYFSDKVDGGEVGHGNS